MRDPDSHRAHWLYRTALTVVGSPIGDFPSPDDPSHTSTGQHPPPQCRGHPSAPGDAAPEPRDHQRIYRVARPRPPPRLDVTPTRLVARRDRQRCGDCRPRLDTERLTREIHRGRWLTGGLESCGSGGVACGGNSARLPESFDEDRYRDRLLLASVHPSGSTARASPILRRWPAGLGRDHARRRGAHRRLERHGRG